MIIFLVFFFFFFFVAQDVVLTISFLALPERFKFIFADDLFKYLLEESFYLMILQQLSFFFLMIGLIRIPSMCLSILFRDVPSTKSVSTNEIVKLVAKWKGNYILVCDLVTAINEFIGWPLFVFIVYAVFVFISFTSITSYRLLSSNKFSFSASFINIYFVFKFMIGIISIAFVSEKIPSQVSCKMNIATKINLRL